MTSVNKFMLHAILVERLLARFVKFPSLETTSRELRCCREVWTQLKQLDEKEIQTRTFSQFMEHI